MNAAELFIKCLENEGVTDIFGIPGEENLDVMDALLDSKIRFITTRHEQGAAFMADVYGRLTGKAGVCLATLGPGATNLVTGVADANMDRAPVVAIAGQASTHRMHKESHQVLDLVNLFAPISKYSTQIRAAEIIPEIVRKAFKVAEAEKPGCSFIDFPENIAEMEITGKSPLKVQSPMPPAPPAEKLRYAAEIISNASFPIIMIGNGVIRAKASEQVVAMAEKLRIPAATTFMAKGVIPSSHELSLGTVGLQAHDYVSCGFDRADVVICIGYDMVEYHPSAWNPEKTHKIIHIDSMAAEVDENYIVETGIIGNISIACEQIASLAKANTNESSVKSLHDTIMNEFKLHSEDNAFPVKPQKIIWDLKQALNDDDIVISDVGAHKMWMARMYQSEKPNTCIISNGFASMGIAVPGAVAAKVASPNTAAIAVTGDAGFMMNSQEISTALMYDIPIVILVWNDGNYGLIKWKQVAKFGRESNIKIQNPDLVKYAESFGAKGYRIEKTEDLLPTLKQAIADNTVVIIDCPVDYDENMKLTEKLGELICPI
ncbi:MAG: acetolactate synthase large subunit [Gammaproteobacteria bacterium]|nr:acetolactate synthase large subunit [Gammaproteobacteria bacterium]